MPSTATRPGWPDTLRRELVAAAARQQGRRRRQRRLRLASVGAVALLALVGSLGLRTPEATAEVRIERDGEQIVVTLVEPGDDPAAVERELREAGIDVGVVAVPTGPSAVGRFVGTTDTGGLPAELVPLGDGHRAFTAFRLPAGWEGSLRLLVGRPARPGEAYAAFTDATAPGEPLAGLPLAGRPAREVLGLLPESAPDVSFRRLDVPGAPALATPDLLGPFAGWVVARADSVAAGQAIVWIVPPPSAPDRPQGEP